MKASRLTVVEVLNHHRECGVECGASEGKHCQQTSTQYYDGLAIYKMQTEGRRIDDPASSFSTFPPECCQPEQGDC